MENEEPKVNAVSELEEMALDDARRVKVLSPTQMVVKRFLRNKLAITGLIILLIMFIFSFLGGLFTPYSQSQVFKGLEWIKKDYATAVYNPDLRVTVKEGQTFSTAAKTQLNYAIGRKLDTFTADDMTYSLVKLGDDFYNIRFQTEVFNGMKNPKGFIYKVDAEPELKAAFEAAFAAGTMQFEHEDKSYLIESKGKTFTVYCGEEIAIASKKIFDAQSISDAGIVSSFDFRFDSQSAMTTGEASFESDGVSYTLETDDYGTVVLKNGEPFATISDITVEPKVKGVVLTADFKNTVRRNICEHIENFELAAAAGSEPERYIINRVNTNYYIQRYEASELIRMKEPPSKEHPLGLDTNGMDVLTRLMYGGRVSLLVGFVVVFFEILLGVIVGGISGYFGGWIDDVCMRLVDLVNSIPFWPVVIIAGSMMDVMQMKSSLRVFFLMFILGILGWTGIARVVRGQILSLKEQDFMIATEATGIPVSRRIFRHLLPNVMPLLIVQATISLGGVIISEATLSFLGLGIKYPLASWGSIINAANDIFIMTNYWYIWIPAGILILITVLGFNFVGDGLRDAFDPKMKR